MSKALEKARAAALRGEVPVGCVIVYKGRVIASGGNAREAGKSALAHAELTAIKRACRALGGWRLWQCELYVTLEPCPMCAGAIVNARIPRVFFGAGDKKAGAFGGLFDMNALGLNHRPEVVGGVLEAECAALLGGFFKELRKKCLRQRRTKSG